MLRVCYAECSPRSRKSAGIKSVCAPVCTESEEGIVWKRYNYEWVSEWVSVEVVLLSSRCEKKPLLPSTWSSFISLSITLDVLPAGELLNSDDHIPTSTQKCLMCQIYFQVFPFITSTQSNMQRHRRGSKVVSAWNIVDYYWSLLQTGTVKKATSLHYNASPPCVKLIQFRSRKGQLDFWKDCESVRESSC